jgi:hypothetical protein
MMNTFGFLHPALLFPQMNQNFQNLAQNNQISLPKQVQQKTVTKKRIEKPAGKSKIKLEIIVQVGFLQVSMRQFFFKYRVSFK